jgi:hypothetical protein
MTSKHHLVVVDADGVADFYLLTDEAMQRYEAWDERHDHEGNCLFEWISSRRKGVKNFTNIVDLIQHVTAQSLQLDPISISTPAY